MPRAKKKLATEAPTGDFRIRIQLGTEVYESTGTDALDALSKLPEPAKIFVKTIVTLSKNGKERTFPLMPVRAKRLFHPLARNYMAKYLDILVK